ncbi:cysteine desulfurase, mitochondrial [Sphaeroforma arctica JP610]|uniref:cysteine desulfurase n=1 Tax=Sphaeroforma arctica JP610 TaxID=667725 RepID=A0A0L0G5L1_9EUKA|nr:cysteine desulfurase, mitochondrial [Sphaeroforma arctica JP610]KNC84091.1 cysteine desulfurase, mitochondrial [Sphaeroforma arctica JP610]|eukprot:XP_014157993.1 cysteine desulfurase, mitochondrial [Sphaeroforma arctica JP610]
MNTLGAKAARGGFAHFAPAMGALNSLRIGARAGNNVQVSNSIRHHSAEEANEFGEFAPPSRPSAHTDRRPLYLDMQATTPMDPRVLDAMLPYQVSLYGNAHSRTHQYGWEAVDAVEEAREQVAHLIGAEDKEIVFTSGATESNNIAVKGVAEFYKGKKKHVITTQTEHKCVLDSCRYLEDQGFEVTYLPVKENGLIDLDQLKAAIRKDTSLVSIMAVNNEIGVVQPLKEIGQICKENKIMFHTDAAQAVGKIPLDVRDMNINLMSISGHKLYGPKGVGALYVQRRPRVRLIAQMSGGGQERGIRSGTLPTPLCVGLGAACSLAEKEMAFDHEHVSKLSKRLIDGINSKLSNVIRNGDPYATYPGCVNLSFAYVEGESLLMALKDIALSSGSACTSASLEPSYVLRAIGTDEDLAHSSIRFGIGRFTTEEEIDYVVAKCLEHVERLRELSPLWEMVQEGIDLKSIQWSQH